MSNEIQVSSFGGAGLPMQPGMPGIGGGLGGYYGGTQTPPTDDSPFKKLHRLLRGRYLLAFVLGFLGAAAGAVAGYISQKPAFKAEGMIEIKPIISSADPTKNESVMVMFSSYVNSQMARLQSDVIVKQAMKDPRWQAVRPGPVTDAAVAAFAEKLTIALPPRSNTIIVVGYADNAPDTQKVAPAAIQSLLDAYYGEYNKDDTLKIEARIKNAENNDRDINNQIAAKRALIQNLSKVSDGDPTQLRYYEQELVEKEKELSLLREAIAAVKQAGSGTFAKPAVEDWARVDGTMASKVKLRDDLALIIGNLAAQLGPNHPQVLSRKRELDALVAYIDQMAATLETRYVIRLNVDGSGHLVPKDITAMTEMEKRLAAEIQKKQTGVQNLREVAAQIESAKFEIRSLGGRSEQIAQDLRDLRFVQQNTVLAKVLNTGSVAKPDKDRRPVFAAIGFMGGACIPIGLLLLFGLLDTRYRYSDETSASVGGTGPGGLTLLGILPNLPDRLSDPEQAAIAAHCVHQIRTMLQINAGMEDRRVFAVTSASPGDGKTSLCLALGLSYAACGTRTLLIDCDLIGSGLSSRMNVNAPEGVLEAITNRTLLPYVRQTDVNDVSILPCGSASNLHASTLSPQSLRRLIEEAEQHYEVILIDTGPILGSIEASLVCAAADAVILTVARGQQRPMVERSLGHLQAIGAKLAGVVFNRAQAQDFERSISGVSIRSVGVPGMPRGARPTGPRLGPVARAVQGQPNEAPSEETNGDGH
ncbi:tyrosine-protein kinase domain-containing protein [Humisphaera borealis]|uniref:non-specific protein-tyrosine kinase n=1 Tax=Humisphaera borealis TaxID=2807512 RepID=A0A7M2X079_9BACT|nr:tyrosine-protein kinase domain-containing protein [Humisphaera borealis]QOV91166.1 AAA family ATPase [Humisphaera borealis]